MSDFPIPVIEPLVTIHTYSQEAIGNSIAACAGTAFTATASAAYPTANLALFIPFKVFKRITAVQMFVYNGATVSGNIDVGIYDKNGVRLISAGSTAQAGTNALQAFNITDTPFGPGTFYLAVALDNTTGTLFRGTLVVNIQPGTLGMAQMATAFALPATATFAQIAGNYIPLIGLTTRVLV